MLVSAILRHHDHQGGNVKRLRTGVLLAALAVSVLAVGCGRSDSGGSSSSSPTTADASAKCKNVTLESTEIGVSSSEITVETMADTGSSLAPGLFQANIDAMNAFAKWVNANGGVGCRQLKVQTWDSKLSPDEAKNGLINGCKTSLAMVGGNSLFNPDTTTLTNCPDKAGQPIGLPNFAALANDVNEQCNPNTWNIQAVAEECKTTSGTRTLRSIVGPVDYYKTLEPNLTGVFLVPGDLPTTVQSATYNIAAQQQDGVKWLNSYKVSGRSEQSAFTPYIQAAKAGNANYMYMGSNDAAQIKLRKEAAAQGFNPKIWACSLACYTQNFRDAGSVVDGTYVWMQFLPFEEASYNETLKTYVDAVGGKPDSFGAQAWQAGLIFKATIDKIVAEQGPNAITRATVLKTMMSITDFDAGGWATKKGPKDVGTCFVVMQINGGKFERKYPQQPGTLACDPKNVATVTLDPQVEAAKIS